MVWYNPLSWRQRNGDDKTSGVQEHLFCANPQCSLEITEERMAYNAEHREVYHPGECQNLAIAHKVFQSGEMMFAGFDFISRKKALQLLGKGKIIQEKLEDKVE